MTKFESKEHSIEIGQTITYHDGFIVLREIFSLKLPFGFRLELKREIPEAKLWLGGTLLDLVPRN